VVVGDANGKTKLALKLPKKAKLSVSADQQVYSIASGSRNLAVLVVDVDRQGVRMVHNLRLVFPSVKIVAVTNDADKALRARRYGATAVVVSSQPAPVVSALVSALLGK
jgi:Zn-dependent alcohol dehydrogenase